LDCKGRGAPKEGSVYFQETVAEWTDRILEVGRFRNIVLMYEDEEK
jgi:hypothetical protein